MSLIKASVGCCETSGHSIRTRTELNVSKSLSIAHAEGGMHVFLSLVGSVSIRFSEVGFTAVQPCGTESVHKHTIWLYF